MVIDNRARPEVLPSAAGGCPPPVLSLDQVVKSFGRTRAVDGVSLTVAPGELVAVVGPSGCGKSTALRLVAGLERPDGGAVRLGARVVAGAGSWIPPERRGVGVVFQDHALFPHLRVDQNVAFGLGGRPERHRARITEILDLVSMTALAQRYPHELSGGEAQRVALARALAPGPPIVLLDEAFSSLDPGLRAQIRTDTVAVLRRTGTAAILVTHDRDEALAVGDRVVVMRAGRIEQGGSPQEVFHRPATRFVAEFVGDAQFLPARRSGGLLVTELGEVPAPAGLPEQGEVELVVRAHEIVVGAGPVPATVLTAEFAGASVRYILRLPSGATVRAEAPHQVCHAPAAELSIRLAAPAETAILLDGQAFSAPASAGAARTRGNGTAVSS